MAAPQKFRSALSGFNREDVVRYIEYSNTKHETEVNRLREELESLRRTLDARESADPEELAALKQQCASLEQENADLKEQLAAAQSQAEAVAAKQVSAEEELAAYRRAERAERIARTRVSQMYDRANGVLADAATDLDGAALQVEKLAQEVADRFRCLQDAVADSKQVLAGAAASLGSIRPGAEEV